VTKQADRRIKQSLERERLRLKDEALALDKRRREINRERDEVIVLLRVLCERWGDNDWLDDLPLAEIIAEHLEAPLVEHLAEVHRRLDTLQGAVSKVQEPPARPHQAPPVARPAPPPAPGEPVHRVLVTSARGTRIDGWRANCTCSWRTGVCMNEDDAIRLGQEHEEMLARRERRA
jgi:hypothetical protein